MKNSFHVYQYCIIGKRQLWSNESPLRFLETACTCAYLALLRKVQNSTCPSALKLRKLRTEVHRVPLLYFPLPPFFKVGRPSTYAAYARCFQWACPDGSPSSLLTLVFWFYFLLVCWYDWRRKPANASPQLISCLPMRLALLFLHIHIFHSYNVRLRLYLKYFNMYCTNFWHYYERVMSICAWV